MPQSINILISTIGERIDQVPAVLMSPQERLSYVISFQTDGTNAIPSEITDRADVTITTLNGCGLCANRNNALAHASADICLIADDDCRYEPQYIQCIADAYRQHPEADIICFAAETYDHQPIHQHYPEGTMNYREAVARGYFLTSFELTFRRASIAGRLQFNTNFGLGSAKLCAGEEQVFMADAERMGLTALFINQVIVRSDPNTTGTRFLSNPKLQVTKGATFRHCYGYANAIWRSIKEAGWWSVYRRANPFPIFLRMMRGIFLKF